jgi:ribosomal-protein-alanine N-acetyltransferase
MVYLEVASGNTAARRLYESFGFTQSGLRQKYYINGEDALILSLSLSE